MKVVLYCDDFLYRKLNMRFPKYDENERIIGSLFSEDEFDNYHISNKKYLNLVLNSLDGIKDIYVLLIQKSWYSDRTCINICKYYSQFHPEGKLIFYMDEGTVGHEFFMHRLVSENLGYVASDMDELEQLFLDDFSEKQEIYELKNLKKKEWKRFERVYLNS